MDIVTLKDLEKLIKAAEETGKDTTDLRKLYDDLKKGNVTLPTEFGQCSQDDYDDIDMVEINPED